jgi:hypothetical protein
VRDVLIASLNKGQFPLALLALIILALIWKLPAEDVSALVFMTFNKLEYWGYPLSVVAFGGWFFHARRQRQLIVAELERISHERDKIQEKTLGGRVKSSEGKP